MLDQLIAKERGINQEVVSQPQTAEKEVATNPENPTVPIQEQNTEAKTNTENDNTDLEQADKKQLLDQAVKKAVPIKVKTENKKETTDQQINAKKGVEKEKKQTESENKATPTSEQDTNVVRMPIENIQTDESRFQGRKKLNESVIKNIAENFSDKDQDPIHIWQDPKDGKTYVLSGHHRYYGAKMAGRNDVKVIDRSADFTEEQAIKFAKEEANANRSMETPLERANTLRDKRNRGDADIKEFLAKEGKNGRYVENLSYLNPKGKVMNMLNQLSETDDRATIKEMERIADWVGEVMKRFDGVLTKAHEDELYDFLMGEKSKRFTNKADFAENVRAIIDKLFFDNNQPLNLNRISNKGDGMRMWEEKRDKLKGELKAVTEKIDNLKARFTDPNHADYVSPDLENYANVVKRKDELLKNLEAERKAIEQKIIEHGRNRKKYLKGDVNTLSLFDVNAMYQKGNTPQRQRISDNTFWKFINKAKRFARGYFGDVKIFTDWNEFKTHANKLNGKDKVKQQKAQDTESLRLEKERIVSEAKANGTYMKAPNGQPTNLNEEQWVAVRTKAFKDWFGDWELGAKEVQIAQAKPHNFKNFAEAKAWAKENIVKIYTDEETAGKGEIKISNTAIDKFFSKSAIEKSETKDAHLSTLKSLPEIIRNSIEAEQHADYLKGEDGIRRKENGINENVTIHRLFGAVNVGGETYRVKVTLKRDRTQKAGKNLYSYETTKIELLAGQNGDPVGTPRYSNNSITGTNLLNGVEKSYEKGEKILDHSKVVDENGEPLVVYHGSPYYGFNVFGEEERSNTMYSQYLSGSYFFTDNKSVAGNFTEKLVSKGVRVYDTLTKWITPQKIEELITSENLDNETSYILRKDPTVKNLIAFVTFSGLRNLKNKDFIEDYKNHKEDVEYDTLKGGIYEVFLNIKNPTYQEGENVSVLTKLQYEDDNTDGIIVTNADTGGGIANEYIVENPNQIKSAIANVGTFSEDSDDIRYHNVQEHKGINATFNEELAQMRGGSLPSGHIFQLGRPNTLLQSAGIPNLPIEMSSARLKTKAMQENHLFDLSEVENLPQAIQNPIGIFAYGDKSKSVNIITELQDKNGKKYLVGIHFNQDRRGLVVNDIRGIFPKDNAEWLNWISQGKGLYLDKKKVQDLITQQQTNLAEVSYLDLNSVTKVLKDFQNPKPNNNLQELRTPSGVVYGAKLSDGSLYFNPDKLNYDTAIHELSHLWEQMFPKEWNEGVELFKKTKQGKEIFKQLKNEGNYNQLSDEQLWSEAMNTFIGKYGEQKMLSRDSAFKKFAEWLKNMIEQIGHRFGIKDLSIDSKFGQFADKVVKDITSGKELKMNETKNSREYKDVERMLDDNFIDVISRFAIKKEC